MPAISGPFPPTPVSSLRPKAGRSDIDTPNKFHLPPSRPPPRPPLDDFDNSAPTPAALYTPMSEYSESQYRTPLPSQTRRPHSNYPSTDEPVYHPHRKYTDPTPQSPYSMDQREHEHEHQPSPPHHQLDVDLDVYSQDYTELEDDQRQPTLSFATTSTVDSNASSPSITNAYTYGPERVTDPAGAKYDKHQHEPRIRMRTGRQDAYASAESSMASGAYSYHAYADSGYNHVPPMPVAPSDIGLARNSEYTRTSSTDDSATSCQAVSPNSPYAQYQPWRSPKMNRDRSESVSTSETTDSSAEDQLSVGFAHSFSYLSRSLPMARRSWEEDEHAPMAEPNALAMVDDGTSAILDHAKLEAMGGAQVLSAMSEDDLVGIPRYTHLLLSGVGPDIIGLLPLLLDVLSTTLVVLDISNNDLGSLPAGLRHCSSLEELNVSNNPLRQLPAFIGDCANLRMLAADNCMLSTMPAEICQLASLHTILVRNNRLIVLPTWLGMLHRLELLRIDNNPFAPQWMPIVAPILSSTIVQSRSRSASASYSHLRSPSQQSYMRSLTSGINSLTTSQSSVAGPSSSTDSLGAAVQSRPGPGPVQSLRTTRSGSRSESPLPTSAMSVRASQPNRSVSGPAPASKEVFAGTERLSTGGPRTKQRRVQSAAHYMTDDSESESADLKASKWGFLRKVSLTRLRTDKDRTAQLSADAAANVSSMPSPGPTISSPVLVGNMPRRPPMTAGWSTNMVPTRSGAEQADLNMSTSSAPSSATQTTAPVALPIMPPGFGRMSRANKRRSFLPIDPSPPSLNVSIPPTSPFMAPQPTLSDAAEQQTYASTTTEDAMETLGEESDSQYGPHSAMSHARPDSVYSVNDEARYTRGLDSIKSYLRDLHDLSLPPAEPYGGFEVLEANAPSETLSPAGDHSVLRASVAESNSSGRNLLNIETGPSRSASMVSSGSERQSKYSAESPDAAPPAKSVKDDKGKRARVVREIYETEKTYVRGLSELVSIYVRPAAVPSGSSKSSESVVPVAERKVVFGGVESILLFHRDNFLPALEKVVQPLIAKGDDEDGATSALAAHQLGEVFRTYIAYMRQYSTYINNFDNALSRMKSWVGPPQNGVSSAPGSKPGSIVGVSAIGAGLAGFVPGDVKPHTGAVLTPSQRKRVKHFLKRAKENPKHSQINLESYLLLPVQRVPRYKLLLEDLAACTPSREAIGPNDALDDAIMEIAKLASLMNEEKREAESRLRLLHWQQRITSRGPSPLVQPHRKLVLDGALQLIRVVKKASSFVEVDSSPTLADGDLTVTGTKAVIPVEYIQPEPMDKPIMLILCSDMLVLVQQRATEGWDGQVDLFSVLRMATLREPASVSASNDRVLRVVDNRSIYYFNGGSHATTLQWCRAINQQNKR